jgi:hypothetical protein
MQGPWLKALQVMLWFVCAAHILIGGSINLFPGMLPIIADAYGANVNWTAEFTYILKPLGAFMVTLGLIAAIAARDPLRYRPVVYAFVLLFVMRCLHRLLFGQLLFDTFGISQSRNVLNLVFFLACGVALVLLERRATREAAA